MLLLVVAGISVETWAAGQTSTPAGLTGRHDHDHEEVSGADIKTQGTSDQKRFGWFGTDSQEIRPDDDGSLKRCDGGREAGGARLWDGLDECFSEPSAEPPGTNQGGPHAWPDR
ncbi:MAG: hypothetical protein HQL73_02530 [Magnetococcales bacterium]|nr:hypothetical protein [Magnetococcales bacterium]